MIATLTRVPIESLDLSRSLGRLDENEIRVLHERLVQVVGVTAIFQNALPAD